MPDVFIANTAAEVDDEFLTRRDQPQQWTQPQAFPAGTAIAPGIVIGASGVGLFEDSGLLHYGVAGVDRGEIIGKNEVSAPGTILGQMVFWNQNILRWLATPNRIVSDDGSQLQPVAGITGPVSFDNVVDGVTTLETLENVDAGAEVHAQRLEVGPGPEFDAFFANSLPLVGYNSLEARFGGVQPAGFTQSSLWSGGVRGLLIDTDQSALFAVSAAAPFFVAGGSVATFGALRVGPDGAVIGTNAAQDTNIRLIALSGADVVIVGEDAFAIRQRGSAFGFFGAVPAAQPNGVTSKVALEALGLALAVAPANDVNFTNLLGVIANAQVPVGAVTQHQGALAINWTQLTGSQPPPIPHIHTYLVGAQDNNTPAAGNYVPDVSGAHVLAVNASNVVALLGMSGGQRGQRMVVNIRTGANAVTIHHLDGTVDPGARISTRNNLPIAIGSGESVSFYYDGTSSLWRETNRNLN